MKSFFYVLLFVAGIALQLALSSGIAWAEIEVNVNGSQNANADLKLSCPIMLSPSETGMVSATVENSTGEDVLPVVTAEFSHSGGAQSQQQTLSLAAHETKIVQWPVDISDLIFGRLILVNIYQARYTDLDPRQASCGILVFGIFNLTGFQSLILIIVSSIAFILIGGILWRKIYLPLDDLAEQTLKICGSLAVATMIGLAFALPRWWGLTILLNVIALIIISIILTDFVFLPRYSRKIDL